MRRRRAIVLLVAAASALAVLRRRRGAHRERVTLGYDDGSMLELEAGTPDADRLLVLARAARG